MFAMLCKLHILRKSFRQLLRWKCCRQSERGRDSFGTVGQTCFFGEPRPKLRIRISSHAVWCAIIGIAGGEKSVLLVSSEPPAKVR